VNAVKPFAKPHPQSAQVDDLSESLFVQEGRVTFTLTTTPRKVVWDVVTSTPESLDKREESADVIDGEVDCVRYRFAWDGGIVGLIYGRERAQHSIPIYVV
jgi:hypothetical protein